MVVVRTKCPDCGRVDIPIPSFHLQLGPPPRYHFTCPKCNSIITTYPPPRAVELLLAGGIVPEPPPLTVDDILDMMLELRKEDP
jgi:predicted RNA-binding Zn-ribbon protein involved in translation (DUF1610 family)